MSIPTDAYELFQYNMIRAHDTFKLGYDIIIKHLKEGVDKDLDNFLGYCHAWATSIEAHHDSEEEVVFPFLNTKMDFSREKEQHVAIHKGISDLEALFSQAKQDHTKFNSSQILDLLVGFKEPLFQHLDEEVQHISAAELKSAGFEEAELKVAVAKLEKFAKSHGDPFLLVPFMRSHTPTDYKDIWPPMPWVLRKLVVPYVLGRRYSGYWKYSPYTMS